MITFIYLLILCISEVKGDKNITIYGFIDEYQKIKTNIEVFAQYSNSIDFLKLNEKGEFKYRHTLKSKSIYLCLSFKCDAECYRFNEATSKYFEKLEFNFSNRCDYSNIISYNYYYSNNHNKCTLTEKQEAIVKSKEIEKEKLIETKEIVIFIEILVIFNIILCNISYEQRYEETTVIVMPFTPSNKLLLNSNGYSDVKIMLNHTYNKNHN